MSCTVAGTHFSGNLSGPTQVATAAWSTSRSVEVTGAVSAIRQQRLAFGPARDGGSTPL